MRSFIAIDFPEELLAGIARLQAGLPVGRKVPPENLHLTLAFLGDLDETALGALDEALSGLHAAPFAIELSGVDLMDRARPDLLYLGVREAPALQVLQRKVMGAVHEAGLQLPRRRFRPHVTLARFRGRLDPAQVARLAGFVEARAGIAFEPLTVCEFALFASELRPEGPRYTELARYPLRG